MLTSLYQSSL